MVSLFPVKTVSVCAALMARFVTGVAILVDS